MGRGLIGKAIRGSAEVAVPWAFQQEKAKILADRDKMLNSFRTGERLAGQEFAAEQKQLDREAAQDIAETRSGGNAAGTRDFLFMTEGMPSEDINKAKRINLGLDPRAVGASAKAVDIGGVPHVFDPIIQAYKPAVMAGQEVTAEDVASSESTIESGKAKGKVIGKAEGEAIVALPQALATAENTISVIDKALNHPGLETATGASSRSDPRNFIPGTDAYSFNVLMDQMQGKTFLQAYQSLKGGGQITEIEGKKAEDAIARLNTGQKTEDFIEALTDLREIVMAGMERSKSATGTNGFASSSGIQFTVE